MKIEAPSDVQYSFGSMSRFEEIAKIPDYQLEKHSRKRKKLEIFKSRSRSHLEGNVNYFQQMYKETKKKVYVNMFVRKMKQAIVKGGQFTHNLFSEQIDKNSGFMKKIKINQRIQALCLFVSILQVWIFSILASMQASFQYLHASQNLQYYFLIPAFGLILEGCFNILIDQQITPIKPKKNSQYVYQSFILYAKSWMIPDIILCLIFLGGAATQQTNFNYLKLLYAIKILPASDNIKKLEIYLIENNFKMQYWELIKIFIFNFAYGHFLAITLVLMAKAQVNWITNAGLTVNGWEDVYIWAYYWATNIMLTVGFGDISASTTQQALVMVFIETLSCIVLAYNINKVGQIINRITSYEEEKFRDLKIFSQMHNREGVSDDSKKKITNFITQSAQLKKKFNVEEEERLLLKLPKTFYEQFKEETNIHIFYSLPFFRCLTTRKIQQLSIKIEKKLAHPEQILIEANTVPKICIVNNGTINYCMHKIGLKNHGKQVQSFTIEQNQYRLLSQYFFINKQVNYDIKCKDYLITFSITNEDLKNILSTNPLSYESYCMVKDADHFNPNDLQADVCTFCSTKQCKSFHTLFECPNLHYIPLKQVIIEKAIRNRKIFQVKQHRRSYRKYSPLKLLKSLKQVFNSQVNIIFSSGKLRLKYLDVDDDSEQLSHSQNCMEDISMNEIENLMRTEYMKSLNGKKKYLQKEEMKKICTELAGKIKEQIAKQTIVINGKDSIFFWDLECDQAHDFNYYFKKENPQSIHINLRKNKRPAFKRLFRPERFSIL